MFCGIAGSEHARIREDMIADSAYPIDKICYGPESITLLTVTMMRHVLSLVGAKSCCLERNLVLIGVLSDNGRRK